MKRTNLSRSNGFARRSGRLPAASSKRKKAMSARKKMLAEFYTGICEGAKRVPDVRCGGPLDPHEPLTRARGGSITEPENLMWICRNHHDWAHAHPLQAHKVGLLRHSWDVAPCVCVPSPENECPRAEECFDNYRADQARNERLLKELGQ